MERERGILLLANILLSISLNSNKVLANVILNKKSYLDLHNVATNTDSGLPDVSALSVDRVSEGSENCCLIFMVKQSKKCET